MAVLIGGLAKLATQKLLLIKDSGGTFLVFFCLNQIGRVLTVGLNYFRDIPDGEGNVVNLFFTVNWPLYCLRNFVNTSLLLSALGERPSVDMPSILK